MHELAKLRLYFLQRHVAAQQTNAAVDIETNSTRGNDTMLFVDCSHAADGETISLVNVGHRQRASDNSGKHRHIRGLLERLISPDRLEQALACEDDGVRQHSGLVGSGNEPAIIVD